MFQAIGIKLLCPSGRELELFKLKIQLSDLGLLFVQLGEVDLGFLRKLLNLVVFGQNVVESFTLKLFQLLLKQFFGLIAFNLMGFFRKLGPIELLFQLFELFLCKLAFFLLQLYLLFKLSLNRLNFEIVVVGEVVDVEVELLLIGFKLAIDSIQADSLFLHNFLQFLNLVNSFMKDKLFRGNLVLPIDPFVLYFFKGYLQVFYLIILTVQFLC